MLGSWQSSGRARHPTNSAKVKEVFQGPVKIWRDRESVKQETEKGKREKKKRERKREREKAKERKRQRGRENQKTGLRQIRNLGNRRSTTN